METCWVFRIFMVAVVAQSGWPGADMQFLPLASTSGYNYPYINTRRAYSAAVDCT